MFADDTQIDKSSNNISSITNILNGDLANVSDWMKVNRSSLNTSKTEYMIIASHKRLRQIRSDPPITLDNNQTKRVKVTMLGLMINETLTWDEQVTLITIKVNKAVNVLRRLSNFFDIKILITVYHTLYNHTWTIVPRYGEAWVPHFVINCMQRLQNRAVRIVTKSGYKVHSVNFLNQLGQPNLEERRNQQLHTLMYKVEHEMVSSSLSNMLQKIDEAHEYLTRQTKHDFYHQSLKQTT